MHYHADKLFTKPSQAKPSQAKPSQAKPALNFFAITPLASLLGGLVIALCSPLSQALQPLNDTGITFCSDGTTNSAVCATVAPDNGSHPRQDARFGRDAAATRGVLTKVGGGIAGFDFTKICNNGEAAGFGTCPANPSLGFGATNWACTHDNVTGLTWEVKTDDNGLRDKDWTYTWLNSNPIQNGGNAGTVGGNTCGATLANCDTEKYTAAVNALAAKLCNAGDWRMPDVEELRSLVDYSKSGLSTTIDLNYFQNTLGAGFWSATAFASVPGLPDGAWIVNFGSGFDSFNVKNFKFAVRLVRGGQ